MLTLTIRGWLSIRVRDGLCGQWVAAAGAQVWGTVACRISFSARSPQHRGFLPLISKLLSDAEPRKTSINAF